MSIELHCEHCGKLVRAPDEAAGKHGKCPSCRQDVYIPTPDDAIEMLDFAPTDERADAEEQRLRRQEDQLRSALLHERELPPERATERRGPAGPVGGQFRILEKDMEAFVISYAAAMAAGKLAEAEAYAADIRSDMTKAEAVMQRLTLDEIPPPGLEEIPRPVLVGFFKQLREK